MLNPHLVATPFIRSEDRALIPIVSPATDRNYWILHFLAATMKWAARLAWASLGRRLTPREYACQFRQLLEDLGGLWIKLGQLLSLRVDMFSEEFCQELSKLQYRVAGFPTSMAREIIFQELGAPTEELFEDFSELPFATASIGQVYRARLKAEGVCVAIKVQRPSIGVEFRRDQKLLSHIARLLCKLPYLRFMRWPEALWEVGEIMREELNYRYEASSLKRMKKSLRPHGVYIPKVFGKYTSERVLVTEFIEGALMSDYIAMSSADPVRLSAWLAANNIDPRIVAKRLMFSLLRQVFEDNLYHGDLHPGNIILLRDSRVALIDLGSVGFTDREDLVRIRMFTLACATGDFSKAADMACMLAPALPPVDLEDVKADVVRALRAWNVRTHVKELPYHEKSIDRALVDVVQAMFRHQIAGSWAMMRIRRVFTTLDSALVYLYPDVNYSGLLRKYFNKAERRRLESAIRNLPTNVVQSLSTVLDLQRQATESMFHLSAILRRDAKVFEDTITNGAFFAQRLFGVLVVVLMATGAGLVLAFLDRYHRSWVQPWLGDQVERVVRTFPAVDTQVFVLVFLADAYLCITALRLKKRFGRRQPSLSTRRTRN
jgi:ubiquinone biosynthesis protein